MSVLSLSAITFSTLAPYLILLAYVFAMVLIAFISRRKSSSLDSFYLSDRGIGGWMSAFAYGTTYFSAVVFIGYAGRFGMSMGLSAIWIGVSNAVVGSYLAWKVLAKRTRQMTHRLDTKTMPEFFEKRYQNKYLKLYSSIVVFIFLIPYSTSVYQGLGYIVETVFNIPFMWCIIIMAALTALYLFVGGYFAEILSDFVQGLIMFVGVALILIFMFKSDFVQGGEGIRKLTEMGYGFVPSFKGDSFIDSPGFNLIILSLLTSFGIWSLPQSVHKFYTIKDNKNAIKQGTIVSSIFALIIGGGAYLNGGLARLFFDTPPQGNTDLVVIEMFNMAGIAPALFGFIATLILAASMSTLCALSLSSASTVSIDLYKGYIKKDASDQQVKVLLRVLCIVFIAISALLAILQVEAIVTLMSLSWGTLAGCFIGPFIYGLYSKKVTAASVYASITFSLIITFALILVFGFIDTPTGSSFGEVIKVGIRRSPLIGVIAMVSSMIITPLVSLFTKTPPKKEVDAMFSEAVE